MMECCVVVSEKSDSALDFSNSLMNVQQMQNLAKIILAISLCLCAESMCAQQRDSTASERGMLPTMYEGGVNALDWYDAPIAAVDLVELIAVSPNSTSKPIKFPPTSFDMNFESHVGVHGSPTVIGRVGDAGAAAFLATRLLVNVGADLAGENVTSFDYYRTFVFYKSIVYTYSLTSLAKHTVFRERPDGSDGESFFSDHSSTAFCAASYLSLELNDWLDRWDRLKPDGALRSTLKIGSSIALYTGAMYVAYSRMHDEKHYFSDVAVGAVVGTVVGTLMYHRYWSEETSFVRDFSFQVENKNPTLCFTLRF